MMNENSSTSLYSYRKDFGISCVIAQSFGDIFFNNSLQNGLLLVTLPRDVCQKLAEYVSTGAEMEVDLEKEEIRCVESDLVVPFQTSPANRKRLLRGTDDIDEALSEADKISAYEAIRREKWGWLELDMSRTRRRVVGNSLEW